MAGNDNSRSSCVEADSRNPADKNILSSIIPQLVINKDKENPDDSGSEGTKQNGKFWLTGLAIAVPLFIASLIGVTIMWLTEVYTNEILKIVTLREGNDIYGVWENSKVPNIVYFYTFNYTNVDEILAGMEIPKVQELGPYVFRESVKRVNIVNNNNGTITFQDYRTHEFIPQLSNGTLDDEILVPNIPLIAALAKQPSSAAFTFMEKIVLRGVLLGLPSDPFLGLKVGEFAWGFGDKFSQVTKNLASFLKRPVPEKFGMLAMRSGLSSDIITLGSGVPDLFNFGIIQRFNGKERIGEWDSEQCDSLKASDGTFFPGKNLSKNSVLYLYVKDFCRRLPLYYEKDLTSVGGFSTYRFAYPDNLFSSGEDNPDNLCFCNGTSCLPSGAQNIEKCMFGAPLAVSYPHFLYGDEKLIGSINGLNPDREKHHSYMDLHTRFGIPLEGWNRFQLNIVIRDNFLLPTYNEIPDKTVLPLAWLGFEIGEVPEDVHNLLYELTYKSANIEIILSWSSLLIAVASGVYIILAIIKIKEIRNARV